MRRPATVDGPELAVQTCQRRLDPLGTVGDSGPGPHCTISWHGPAKMEPNRPASEATVQALSGLMHLHGRDAGRPQRLGLEVASVAAGTLASQGLLAALIGRCRGLDIDAVQTSVLQGALLLSCHYIAAATAAATAADDDTPFPARQVDPGPPFATADGHLVEIETLDPESWKAFWTRLGAADADLGRAWALFRARYYAGACSLPPGLHQATARHGLAELSAIAETCRVSLTPVRSYREVLADPGWSPGYPTLAPLGRSEAPGEPVPASRPTSSGELPLSGIRVIETTTRMQGPLAGLLLGMLGAEVIKVEPPGGDFGRVVPPAAGDIGSFFSCFNRGKHSVEINLTTPAGRSELTDLVAASDVFLHNWRPGKAAEWGLEAADLARVNPSLVYTEASGWGTLAEPAALVGTDFLVQAYAGVADANCPQGEPAVPSRVLLTDCMGALNTSEGMLRGLLAREESGGGQRVSTSLFGGAMCLQAHVLEALAEGREHRRRQGRPQWGPLDQPIETADGVVVVSAEEPDARRRLEQILGCTPSSADADLAHRLALGAAAEWETLLLDAGIPCAVVGPDDDLAALPADDRLADLFEPLAGTAVVPRSPWSFAS